MATSLLVAGLAFALEGDGRYRPWPVLAVWLASIALLLIGAARLERAPLPCLPPLRLHIARWEWALMAALTLVAVLIRAIALGHVPENFSGDEGEMGSEARAVISGALRDPFTTGWQSHPTLWFYLQAAALRVFGNGVVGLRLLSALLGAATVPVLYLFARRLFGARVALGAAALLAVYHFHVHFSRIGLNNVADPLFALLAFTSFLEGYRRRSPLLLALAGILVGIDQHLYFAGRLAPILIVVLLLHQLIADRQTLRAAARFLPLVALGFFVGFGPLPRVPLLHWAEYSARLASEGIFQTGWYHAQVAAGRSPPDVLATQVGHALGGFGFISDRGPQYNAGMPLLDALSFGLFTCGVLVLGARIRRTESALVLAWLLATVVASALLVQNPASEHYVTAAPAMCLAIACGIDGVVRHTGSALPRPRRAAGTAFGVAILALGAWSVSFYFRDYSPREAYGFERTGTATAVAHYLAPRARNSYVYLLGAPTLHLSNGTLRFLAPGLRGTDVPEGSRTTDLRRIAAGSRVLVVATPSRFRELAAIARTRPGGKTVAIRGGPNDEVVSRAYKLP